MTTVSIFLCLQEKRLILLPGDFKKLLKALSMSKFVR
jgi:hypothetical protein